MRECGLKQQELYLTMPLTAVTPRAGVWIETVVGNTNGANGGVTPRAGVWIETQSDRYDTRYTLSLPVRECGLKHA